ncbi:MAG: selenium-dependent molybdenum cofactor biosynthesis protein YqeB [Brevefilum sp.]
MTPPYVLLWGGGDLASGVILRLHRVGIRTLVVEKNQPLVVRRSVAFANAVFERQMQVEDITGILIESPDEMIGVWEEGKVPIIVDPELTLASEVRPLVLVDARMRKKHVQIDLAIAEMVVGLGPGFVVGENCHASVETNRGHFLGRVYWQGEPEADTGIPGKVGPYTRERVLHAPESGTVQTIKNIGDTVVKGEPILVVGGEQVMAPFDGVLRGLVHDGLKVRRGMKVGDVDPRPETFRCWTVSEKSLAIGGGVLEAVLTDPNLRDKLWES